MYLTNYIIQNLIAPEDIDCDWCTSPIKKGEELVLVIKPHERDNRIYHASCFKHHIKGRFILDVKPFPQSRRVQASQPSQPSQKSQKNAAPATASRHTPFNRRETPFNFSPRDSDGQSTLSRKKRAKSPLRASHS